MDWRTVDPTLWNHVVAAMRGMRWPIVLSGDVGTGKTYAAMAFYTRWKHMAGQYEPEFWRASDLVRLVVDAEFGRPGVIPRGNGQSVEATLGKLEDICRRCDLLVLDDVGTVTPNGPSVKALLSVLDWTQGRPLLVTTNWDEAKIEELFGSPVASRMFAGATVTFSGFDRRVR